MNELSKCLNYMHYNESIIQIVPAVARIGNVKYKNIKKCCAYVTQNSIFLQPANNQAHHFIM